MYPKTLLAHTHKSKQGWTKHCHPYKGNSVRVLTSGDLKPMTLALMVREVLPLFPGMLLPEEHLLSVMMGTRLILLGKNLTPLKSKNICLLPKWNRSILKKQNPPTPQPTCQHAPKQGTQGEALAEALGAAGAALLEQRPNPEPREKDWKDWKPH